MALIIEAPNEIYSIENSNNVHMFLAGGITNCPDWQKEVLEKLKIIDHLTIYSPRRANFPIGDPNAAEEQITWEYEHLMTADILFFWYSRGSLNPIVMLEYGKYALATERPVIIGVDPEYERKQDVEIQTKLARPQLPIYDSLDDMVNAVFDAFEQH